MIPIPTELVLYVLFIFVIPIGCTIGFTVRFILRKFLKLPATKQWADLIFGNIGLLTGLVILVDKTIPEVCKFLIAVIIASWFVCVFRVSQLILIRKRNLTDTAQKSPNV